MPNSQSNANETFLMHLPTMLVQSIRIVKPPLTEPAHGMLFLQMYVQLALPLLGRVLIASTGRCRMR